MGVPFLGVPLEGVHSIWGVKGIALNFGNPHIAVTPVTTADRAHRVLAALKTLLMNRPGQEANL